MNDHPGIIYGFIHKKCHKAMQTVARGIKNI